MTVAWHVVYTVRSEDGPILTSHGWDLYKHKISREEMWERPLSVDQNFPRVSMRHHPDWGKLQDGIHRSGQVVELQEYLVSTAIECHIREGDKGHSW